jgi:Ca2+-binding EF-hand superfamily protein
MSFGVENKEDLVAPIGNKITSQFEPLIANAEKKQLKRLNATQLEDLFRRLDINNDNELDLEEFLIVIQKLDVGSKTKELDKDFLAT